MTEQERWTIGRLLQWTTDYLKQQGSSSPRLDAELLLAEACGCQRIELYTAFEDVPADDVRTRFRELVKRRAGGEPVAYLLGRREFFSLSFRVSPAVLVPRPETEFVVIAALDAMKANAFQSPVQVADIGTGSGIIAISIAKHAPQTQITAVDLSREALQVAQQNAADHEVADRIEFVEGDLFDPVPAERQFDIIASNPPYVAESEMDLLAKETRKHEPRQALFAGKDGLDVITRLIDQAAGRLRGGGTLIFEISPMQENKARELLEKNPAFGELKVTKDLAALPRVLSARRQ